MNDLFSSIATIAVDRTSQLTQQDKSSLQALIDQGLEATTEKEQMIDFIETLPDWNGKHLDSSNTEKKYKEWTTSLEVECKSVLEKVLRNLFEYMNTQYKLSVSYTKASKPSYPDIESFLEAYFVMGNISNLSASGITKLKNDFRSKIGGYESVGFKKYKMSIQLDSYCSFYHGYDKVQWGYRDFQEEKNKAMRNALVFFETGSINGQCQPITANITCQSWDPVSFDKLELDTTKIEAIQISKNGSIKIWFRTQEYCTEFYQLFDMGTIRPFKDR